MKFILASHNKKKLSEVSAIVENLGIELLPQPDLGGNIEENGSSFEENALIKATEVLKRTGLPAIADDSGLCVDALNGEPGIYSARYGEEGLDDLGRNNLLLKNMEGIPKGKRGAKFVCAIACAFSDREPIIVRGECQGEISFERKGDGGFGYDPLFYVPQYDMTFAQLSSDIKNKISHRAIALKKLSDKFQQIF